MIEATGFRNVMSLLASEVTTTSPGQKMSRNAHGLEGCEGRIRKMRFCHPWGYCCG